MNIRLLLLLFSLLTGEAFALPSGFVYLKDVDPRIIQDMRYAGYHNFIGKPITGYKAGTCILTAEAAGALSKVQQILLKSSLSLKVYDCYRPASAVAEFMQWSDNENAQEMKQEFYPRVNKADVFRLGYVAEKSGHSRGSTIDLTIVKLPAAKEPGFQPGQKLVPCYYSKQKRFKDNSLDMGAGYDCLDVISHVDAASISHTAYQNRMLLRNVMLQNGFKPYEKEWWHFTLEKEPYSARYFNFNVL